MFAVLGADMCVLCVAMVGLAVAFAMRGTAAAKGLGVVTLLLAVTPVLIGGVGYAMGMNAVERAVSMADPAQRDMLRAYGQAEAMTNVWFGGGSLLCTLPAAMIVLGVSFLAKPASPDPV